MGMHGCARVRVTYNEESMSLCWQLIRFNFKRKKEVGAKIKPMTSMEPCPMSKRHELCRDDCVFGKV